MNEITLKQTRELKYLADRAKKSPAAFANELCNSLIDSGLIASDDGFGLNIYDGRICDSFFVKDIIEILNKVGIKEVTCKDYDALIKCQIFGIYDCPGCGSKMEETDTISIETHCATHYSEAEYEDIAIEKTCPYCGHVEIENV